MKEGAKRPATVWLTQVMLVIFLLLDIFIIVNGLVYASAAGQSIMWSFRQILWLIALFSVAVMLVAAFWGLVKRKAYGRWLSLALLTFLWAIMLLSQLYPSPGPIKRYEYDNGTQRVAGGVTQVVIHALILTLLFRLAFARRVSEFFRYKML